MKGYYILRINYLNGDVKEIIRNSYNAILRQLVKYSDSDNVSYIDCDGYNHKDSEENGWLFTENINSL